MCRQSQLAKMTPELCEDRGDEQREKGARAASKASSVSPLSAVTSLELPGPWSNPTSPVTLLPPPPRCSGLPSLPLSLQILINFFLLSHQEADGSHRPLRPPPGLGCSSRGQPAANDNVTNWLRLLLEAEDTRGEVRALKQLLPFRSSSKLSSQYLLQAVTSQPHAQTLNIRTEPNVKTAVLACHHR